MEYSEPIPIINKPAVLPDLRSYQLLLQLDPVAQVQAATRWDSSPACSRVSK